MAMLAMCLPILPGKKEKWLEMMNHVLAKGTDAGAWVQDLKRSGWRS